MAVYFLFLKKKKTKKKSICIVHYITSYGHSIEGKKVRKQSDNMFTVTRLSPHNLGVVYGEEVFFRCNLYEKKDERELKGELKAEGVK